MPQKTIKAPAKSLSKVAKKGADIKLVHADIKNVTGLLNELVMIDLDIKRRKDKESKNESIRSSNTTD